MSKPSIIVGRLLNCYHPKYVFNRYTGEKQVVRCGKCNACCNAHVAHWITRCDMESACHKYCWFVNLSYDDFNVPQLVRLRSDDSDHIVYIDHSTGELFDSYDVPVQFSDKDKQYCYDTKVLNVLSKRDIQLFIKRLRYEFTKIDETARLRYYCTGEIGPSTYRPHYHCLIWFDSERCNQQFEALLHKTWTFGNIYQPHIVSGSAAQYVSAYINSTASLPAIYLHPGIRPFSLKSSSPAIGSLYPLLGKEQDIINGRDIEFTRYNAKSRKFENVPFWRSLENRLYPRCQRFGCLTHDDRVTLYREMAEFISSFDSEPCSVIAERIKRKYVDSHREDFLGRYFFEISHKTVFKYSFVHHDANLKGFENLPFLPSDVFFERPFTAIKTISREFCQDSLVRFVRSLSRALNNASMLGVTITQFVSLIESYYDKKSNNTLRKDYIFQDEYFKTHPKWHYIYFDVAFYRKVTTTDFNSWSSSTLFTLGHLFDCDSCKIPLVYNKEYGYMVLDIPALESLDDYRSFKLLHDKISHELVKQKKNNDYALAHKDKFFNVLRFQNS